MDRPIVLFVDDEPNILKTLRRLFMEEDYEIHTAANGREGLALLEGGLRPAVIISDQRMPEMGGAEFLAKAKELAPDGIRMVLTGYADINAAVAAINLGGIYRYILKPWNDDDLKVTVREALRYYQLSMENRALTAELEVKNKKLAEVNEQLEEMVRKRTAELHQKVRELEGRDTIQQYLLRVHPLSELLETALKVVVAVCDVEGAAYYEAGGNAALKRLAVYPEDGGGTGEAEQVEGQISAYVAGLGGQIREGAGGQTFQAGDVSCGIVPVATGSKFFGVLLLSRGTCRRRPIGETEMASAAGFAMQVAIGINDCQVQEHYGDIGNTLDDVLSGIDGI